MNVSKKIILFFSTLLASCSLWASVIVPGTIALGNLELTYTSAFVILAFVLQWIGMLLLVRKNYIKVTFVTVLMTLASALLVTWGPLLIIDNIVTGKFVRYMLYLDVTALTKTLATFYGAMALLIWLIMNVAIELTVAALFFHDINKRKLFLLLIMTHAVSLGLAFVGIQIEGFPTLRKKPRKTRVVRKPVEKPKVEPLVEPVKKSDAIPSSN